MLSPAVFSQAVLSQAVLSQAVSSQALLEVHLRQYSTMKVIFLLTEEVVNTYKPLPCDYEQPSLKSTPEDPLLELILHLRVIHAFIR